MSRYTVQHPESNIAGNIYSDFFYKHKTLVSHMDKAPAGIIYNVYFIKTHNIYLAQKKKQAKKQTNKQTDPRRCSAIR